jgi:hypothetical protein
MAEDTGEDTGSGLDTTVSNDMFAGDAIEQTMNDAFDSNQEPDQSRGEDGRFTKQNSESDEEAGEEVSEETAQDTEAQTDKDTQETAEDEESTQEEVKPKHDLPLGWDKDKSADWESMTEGQQSQFIKRNNQFAAKIQQSVEGKKFADQIKSIEAPYQAMIQAEGADTMTAYQDYLKTAYQLRNGTPEQKAQILNGIAQTYNVPVNGGQQQAQQDDIYIDPDIQALQNTINAQNQRLAQMEQRATQQDQQSQQHEMQSIDSEISKFAQAEGHEHFDAVRSTMGAFMSNGLAEDMDQAYDMAINANPEIRKTLQATAKKEADTARTREAQEDAKRAEKTAGTNLKSKGGVGSKKIAAKSMEQTMEEAYDKAMSR